LVKAVVGDFSDSSGGGGAHRLRGGRGFHNDTSGVRYVGEELDTGRTNLWGCSQQLRGLPCVSVSAVYSITLCIFFGSLVAIWVWYRRPCWLRALCRVSLLPWWRTSPRNGHSSLCTFNSMNSNEFQLKRFTLKATKQ
jgi:hypothetical protein